MKQAISTSIEQSRRLLSCGVDPKTADMVWLNRGQWPAFLSFNEGCNRAIPEVGDMPSWSLSMLISLLPMSIREDDTDFTLQLEASPNEEERYKWCVCYYDKGIELSACYNEASTPIEACVQMIEWLCDNGYSLNKIEE